MDTAEKTDLLMIVRSLIPAFECLPGCTDCCGPVPRAGIEWDRIRDKRAATGLTCPYASKQGCTVYKERPILCRLFGASEEVRLQCPHGRRPPAPLSLLQTRVVMEMYGRLTDEDETEPTRLPTQQDD